MNTPNHGKKDAFSMSLTGYTLKRTQTGKNTIHHLKSQINTMSKNSTLNILFRVKNQLENSIASGDSLDSDKKLLDETEKSIKWVNSCNGFLLQENRKKCVVCGQMFTAKNKQQEFCSGKCRVRFHRVNTQLQKFNQKVKAILRNEKFIIEQIITSEGKCPFVVYCNGKKYQSDSTKSLLSQIKRSIY